MIVRYFDKDGKEHKLKLNRPIFICSEVGSTSDYSEIKIEEQTRFNKHLEQYETSGCFQLSPASQAARPMGIVPSEYGNGLVIGPVKQM